MPALTFDDLLPGPVTPGGVAVGASGRPRVVIGPDSGTTSNALDFSDLIPESTVDKVARIGKDVGLSAISGLDKGVAGLAGLPADLGGWAQQKLEEAQAKFQGRPLEEVHAERAKDYVISPETLAAYGAQAAHANSPLRHDPTTTAGKYAETGAEFVPAAVLGPGNVIRNAVTMGIVPGLASEAAGQATEGGQYEPWARGGAALLGGGVGAWINAPNKAGAAISAATHGITDAHLDAAEHLFQQAQQAGLPITRAEALQHVTGAATDLGNLQRVVEGSGQMRPFFAQRPAQTEQAARAAFDAISPQSLNPSQIGPQIGQAAERIVGDATAAVNRASRPYYQAAEPTRVGPQVHAAFMADPLYAQTLREIRGNPALNRTIENLPDDSVGVIDLVQRRMREQAENARVPGQASTSNLAAANFEDARTAPIAAADNITGSRPGVAGSYETARAIQQQLRETYLSPILNGPVGKLAQRDLPTKRAIEALFPANPLPGSQHEIGQAVTALAARHPGAARQLVRAHVESVFNESVQRLQSGANEFGGAGFAAVLRGNPQQAANLREAITALRGTQAYEGFDRFLNILEAQGTRQRIGSQTAFNQEVQRTLREGGTVEKVLTGAATGGFKYPQQVRDSIQRWRLGRNVNQIADVLTNPDAARLFRELARTQPASAKATALTTRLVYMATQDQRTR